MVVDTKASNFKKQKEDEIEAFQASIPTYSLGGVGQHPVNAKDALHLHQLQAEVQYKGKFFLLEKELEYMFENGEYTVKGQ